MAQQYYDWTKNQEAVNEIRTLNSQLFEAKKGYETEWAEYRRLSNHPSPDYAYRRAQEWSKRADEIEQRIKRIKETGMSTKQRALLERRYTSQGFVLGRGKSRYTQTITNLGRNKKMGLLPGVGQHAIFETNIYDRRPEIRRIQFIAPSKFNKILGGLPQTQAKYEKRKVKEKVRGYPRKPFSNWGHSDFIDVVSNFGDIMGVEEPKPLIKF